LEKILFHASGNAELRDLLLRDRDAAVAMCGVVLRDTERAVLALASDDDLRTMIGGIVPANPKRRRFMGLVAAAAASLAAGGVLLEAGCDSQSISRGVSPDTETDTEDAGTDGGETDTVETDIETDMDGNRPDWPDDWGGGE
jgi:hypothetical protein